jgi:hypothetical protein
MHVADYQNRIERLTRSTCRFDEIEETIDGLPLTSEQKAALWLLAWTHQDRRTQLRVAHEALAASCAT